MAQVIDEFCLLYLASFLLVVLKCSDVRYLAAHCAVVHATVVVHSKRNLESSFCQGAQLVSSRWRPCGWILFIIFGGFFFGCSKVLWCALSGRPLRVSACNYFFSSFFFFKKAWNRITKWRDHELWNHKMRGSPVLYLAGFLLILPECSDVRYLAAHCAAHSACNCRST